MDRQYFNTHLDVNVDRLISCFFVFLLLLLFDLQILSRNDLLLILHNVAVAYTVAVFIYGYVYRKKIY